jgi:HK97 family phage major capsid protein
MSEETLTEDRVAEIAAGAAALAIEGLEKTPKADIHVIEDETDKLMKASGGFKSLGHFCYDVMKADTNQGTSELLRGYQDAVKKTEMEEGDLSQGGYLVPAEFGGKIDKESLEASIVKPRARVYPMKSNRLTFAADVDADHSASYFGGITIYRTAELAAKTVSKPTYAQVALTLHKLTGLVYVSDELLEDSVVALEAELSRKFGQAIAFVEDDDYLNGTGVNMALGAINAGNPSLITVAAIGGQGAGTIIAENIRDMWQQLYPSGQKNAVWIANIETFSQLFGMAMAVGAGGVPVWLPAGGTSGSPYQTLMGRPLIFTEKCQALGTAGDIALCDFSQYAIGQRGGTKTAMSMHVGFVYDKTAFRFVLRYDGQPTWLTTLTPRRGTNTLSPFIVLNSTRT